MLADDPALAQGVFRMLLAGDLGTGAVDSPVIRSQVVVDQTLPPLDRMLFLRQHPWLEGASFKQLRALADVTLELPLEAGHILFTRGEIPAVYQVLQGEVMLESDTESPIRVGAGGTLGLVETLANVPWSRQAKVSSGGRALRLNRDDLLAAAGDLGFLESLLSSVVS